MEVILVPHGLGERNLTLPHSHHSPKNGAGISKVNSNKDEIMKMRLNITSKMLIGFGGLVIKAEDYEDHQSKSLTLNHISGITLCVYIGRGGGGLG